MDLAFLRFPHQFRKKDLYTLVNWTKRSVKQASHIFTISQFSKKEIEYFYNYPASQITVTYPGIANLKSQNSPVSPRLSRGRAKPQLKIKIFTKYKIEKNKYFLYIGTLQPRKNLIRLIEAFAQIISHQPLVIDYLVVVGKKGWLYQEIFEKVKTLGVEKNIIFTGYVEEEEKAVLLKNALALVLPSLYEGFGMPVLEAMQLGCPVIVSKNSSLSEIVGEAGLYIDDPLSVSGVKKVLLKMVKLNQNQRQILIKSGFKQTKKFSWAKTTKKTLKILKEVANVYH
jgi:glycosyltransferase involved in cell wall biosynthesis